MRKGIVIDSVGAAADSSMPQLAVALDYDRVRRILKRGLRVLLKNPEDVLRLEKIEVLRHKPGKRCVVQYDVFIDPPRDQEQAFAILGKIRARRAPATSFNLQQAFWRAGFHRETPDGIHVAELIGVIDEIQMWFQRKELGIIATNLFVPGTPPGLGRRIAEAATKIHKANIVIGKAHGISDELRILKECFAIVSQQRPAFADRLAKLFEKCERASGRLGGRPIVGIHRDFYADQILVDGDRLVLLDFDLYCHGDPALDIGNFVGHLTEQGLREHNDPAALRRLENALEERFLELNGVEHERAICVYTNLTLARHIFLSAKFPERSHLTEPLLRLCEERFSE